MYQIFEQARKNLWCCNPSIKSVGPRGEAGKVGSMLSRLKFRMVMVAETQPRHGRLPSYLGTICAPNPPGNKAEAVRISAPADCKNWMCVKRWTGSEHIRTVYIGDQCWGSLPLSAKALVNPNPGDFSMDQVPRSPTSCPPCRTADDIEGCSTS